MRDFRFRAWDKEKQAMTYYHPLAHTQSYNQLACQPSTEDQEDWIDTWTTKRTEDLMQYTGLLDRNGKEIYEGDILKERNDEAVVYVEWGEDSWWFCYNEKNRWTYDWMVNEQDEKWRFEIIGNIYENPELLSDAV